MLPASHTTGVGREECLYNNGRRALIYIYNAVLLISATAGRAHTLTRYRHGPASAIRARAALASAVPGTSADNSLHKHRPGERR